MIKADLLEIGVVMQADIIKVKQIIKNLLLRFMD